MAHVLSAEQVKEMLSTLCGSYDVILGCGKVRLLARTLPGKAVAAILPDAGDGVFRLVYDTTKPSAFQHTQEMIREWWESFREPEAFPDGTVELMARVAPPADCGPIPVTVVPRSAID